MRSALKASQGISCQLTTEVFQFEEVEFCGAYNDRIGAASIDVKKGLIVFQKDRQAKAVDLKANDCYNNEDPADKDYNFKAFQRKMSVLGMNECRHHKGENYKPIRNNLKTRPVRKIQRDNRDLLGRVKMNLFDKGNLYDADDFLNDCLSHFDFNADPFF